MSECLTIKPRGNPAHHGAATSSSNEPISTLGTFCDAAQVAGAIPLRQQVLRPKLIRAARDGCRLLLRGFQRYTPWLHELNSRWFYECYFSHRYAKEYRQRRFTYKPLISIILPVYNPPRQFLAKAVASIERQKYARWELCIADDASTDSNVRPYLEQLQARQSRAKIVFLEKNQHISRATNAAMQMATGDYFLFMDNDDTLFTPWAITALVDALQQDRADLLYADNVMIDQRDSVRSFAPKPDWDIEFLMSTCYITHPLMVGRQLMEKLGGFRPECSGAQDIDLVIRASSLGPKVKHLSKFLYGWRMSSGSVATSTDAKPTIIPRSLRSYNDLLRERQSVAVSTWPPYFKKKRIGAFKLQFPHLDRLVHSLALVVLGGDASPPAEQWSRMIPYPVSDVVALPRDRRLARRSKKNLPSPFGREAGSEGLAERCTLEKSSCRQTALTLTLSQRERGPMTGLKRSERLAEALLRLKSEFVLFLDSSIDVAYTSAIDELLGYLLLDEQIGVVAGKVLDHEHRIRCSSYAFQQDLSMTGGGWRDADYEGYWYKNRLAHNSLAVPDRFFLTRRRLLVDYGLAFDEFGDYAVADYCLRLRNDEIRTVYNPWAVCLSPEMRLPRTAGRDYRAFKNKYSHFFGKDPYYLKCG